MLRGNQPENYFLLWGGGGWAIPILRNTHLKVDGVPVESLLNRAPKWLLSNTTDSYGHFGEHSGRPAAAERCDQLDDQPGRPGAT